MKTVTLDTITLTFPGGAEESYSRLNDEELKLGEINSKSLIDAANKAVDNCIKSGAFLVNFETPETYEIKFKTHRITRIMK